jgi:hypothetical protein
MWLFLLGISCTVFVLICTVVVLYGFIMCVCVRACVCVCMGGFCNVCICVGFVMCGCFGNMYTVLWLRVSCAFSSVVSHMPGWNSQRRGTARTLPHYLLFVLFYILFVCKCVLPPGDNPTAVNKHIISYQTYHIISYNDFRFSPRIRRELHSSGFLGSV